MKTDFRKLDVPLADCGAVYLHSMPGRREPMDDFLAAADSRNIVYIACLTSMEEIAVKSPAYETALKSISIRQSVLAYPVPDFGIPNDSEKFSDYIKELAGYLLRGNNLLIHCGAGIGRTGLCAVCLLCVLGLQVERATELVRIRGSGPETEEQAAFIQEFAEKFK